MNSNIESALELKQISNDMFISRTLWLPLGARGVFGGQIIGQSLVAASSTVHPDFHVHSMHSYFLLPGDSKKEVKYSVTRLRDGKSFTTRLVVATQPFPANSAVSSNAENSAKSEKAREFANSSKSENSEKPPIAPDKDVPIFAAMCSFQRPSPTPFVHQVKMPVVIPPENLKSTHDILEDWLGVVPKKSPYHNLIRMRLQDPIPVEIRPVNPPNPQDYLNPQKRQPKQMIWIKAKGTVSPELDTAAFHNCIAAYCSDHYLLTSSLLAHGVTAISSPNRLQMMASLDHVLWFHAPFRADNWLLYEMASPWSAFGRGLAVGRIWSRDGTLLVSVGQEGVIRIGDTRGAKL